MLLKNKEHFVEVSLETRQPGHLFAEGSVHSLWWSIKCNDTGVIKRYIRHKAEVVGLNTTSSGLLFLRSLSLSVHIYPSVVS